MYIPSHYLEDGWEKQESLIRAYPLGTVITSSDEGIIANHIPFLLVIDLETGKRYLRAHMAKKNHQLPSLKEGQSEVLVIFQSPDSYISPSYYPTKKETEKRVPTWDFASLHCYGKARIIDDPQWVRNQLDGFTFLQEKSREEPWKVSDAPENYVKLLQRVIMGLEIEIDRTECKYKFEQEMKRQDIDGVIEGLRQDNKPEVSQFVETANSEA